MTRDQTGDKATAETWRRELQKDRAWSWLIVPEAEGFDLSMPTWVADRIIADHNRVAAAEADTQDVPEHIRLDPWWQNFRTALAAAEALAQLEAVTKERNALQRLLKDQLHERDALQSQLEVTKAALTNIKDEPEPEGLNFVQALAFHAMQICAESALTAPQQAPGEAGGAG